MSWAELVGGFVDRGTNGVGVERVVVGDGHGAAVEVNGDIGDAGQLGELASDGVDAVPAGHAVDLVGGSCHQWLPDSAVGSSGRRRVPNRVTSRRRPEVARDLDPTWSAV